MDAERTAWSTALLGIVEVAEGLSSWVEAPGVLPTLSDPAERSELEKACGDLEVALDGHVAGGAVVLVRCPRCRTVITTLRPPPALALGEVLRPGALRPLDVRCIGTRMLDVSATPHKGTRARLVCQRKRCGRTVTISMRLLVERFIAAVGAGRSDLELDY
jgi:hypothetical protein